MKREKQTTISLVTRLLKELEEVVKDLEVLIHRLFLIFLKIFLVILVEAVLVEDQVIEGMI